MILVWLFSAVALSFSVPQLCAHSFDASVDRSKHGIPVQSRKAAPNRAVGKKVSCSGVAVQAVKSSNPLQLICPFASSSCGQGYDNVARNPVTGEADGISFFSVEF